MNDSCMLWKIINSILLLALVSACFNSFALEPYPFSVESELLCKGKFSEAYTSLDKFLKENPERADAYLIRNYGSSDVASESVKRQRPMINDGTIPGGELQRLDLVHALLEIRTHDFKRIKELLEFESSDVFIEANRLALLSYMYSLDGKYKEAFSLNAKSVDILPYLDERSVYSSFWGDPKQVPVNERIEKWKPEIEKMPKTSPYFYAIKSLLQEFQKQGSPVEIHELNKKAYDLCPHDSMLLTTYLDGLLRKGNAVEGNKVIRSYLNNKEYYPPHVDLYMAITAVSLGDFKTAETYYAKVEDAMPYFKNGNEHYVDWLRDEFTRKKSEGKSTLLVFGILVLLIGGAIFLNSKRSSSSSASIIEDQDAYDRATKEVASKSGDLVIVGKYSTSEGYTEEDLMKRVVLLGEHGINANYRSTGVGIEGGAITVFVLNCDPEKFQEAKEVLELEDRKGS